MRIENVEATETGAAMSEHLKSNGWDGVVYMGEVVRPRSRRSAMLYRNASTGEFEVVVEVRA